ncbi:hypothetical protein LguiA_032317 [Lonicera macranthoides]
MGRAPCCDKANVKKGPWSPEEDAKLKEYMQNYGTGGNWIALPKKAGLKRCGKSCRLRWLNYLRPNIKHGEFSDDEDRIIYSLFANIGSRWSIIAAKLPGRTDNDIKNHWNTKLKKKLMGSMDSNSSPLAFKCTNNYYNPPRPLTCYDNETPSFQSTLLMNSSNISSMKFLESQDGYVGPTRHNQVKDNINLLVFGSSSDQSSSNSSNQYGHHVYYNGVDEEKKITDDDQKPINGFYGETQLDYSPLEEIKELISPNYACNDLNFFVEENKRVEQVMYY